MSVGSDMLSATWLASMTEESSEGMPGLLVAGLMLLCARVGDDEDIDNVEMSSVLSISGLRSMHTSGRQAVSERAVSSSGASVVGRCTNDLKVGVNGRPCRVRRCQFWD